VNKSISLPNVSLIMGGARSGKSRYAEVLLDNFENPIYLATAEARHKDDQDGEMAARIAQHKKRRGPQWRTLEEPINIIDILNDHANAPVMVDCMTLWLANIMSAGLGVEKELEVLAECLRALTGPLVLVSNEVGQGIVPDNALARSYVDSAGLMNQRLAACSNQVVVMHAGIPQVLKEG
jgi:adenosylcobinamide kinase/adenosylcobinamide-phosphate guanylyltransferase